MVRISELNRRIVTFFLAIAASVATAATLAAQTPTVHVEIGTLDGAPFRIDMPASWNGVLLMYYHGYTATPATFAKDKPNPMGERLAAQGFAVAQSAYSVTGWAVEEALWQTEALRRYAIAHYGQPKETYVLGHSLGGMLTAATLESYPNRYDGALSLCGLLEPATWTLQRVSAMRAAFDYYYPGLLPGPLHVPSSAALSEDQVAAVMKALPTNPKGQAELMALGHFKTVDDLAERMVSVTYVLRDMEEKIGSPALDNHNFIYAGGADDNALNDGVKRYTPTEAAIGYLKTWYTPTGVLTRPMLAVHTTYDPTVPPESVSVYADLVERNGSGRNFVQQYVKADGHCQIDGPQTAAALEELIEWKRNSKRPSDGVVPTPAQ